MASGGTILLIILGVIAAIVVGVFALIYLVVPFFKAVGWVLRQIFNFVVGEVSDVFRFVGAIILGIVYIPLILANVIIGRWSASGHYGRALQGEISTLFLCLYRVAIGHPMRLVGLSGVTEGLERRLPAVVAAAPTSDRPHARTGLFEGYKIVGSLAGGGSGAKLYIAEPDAVKAAAFARTGLREVGQVVIKSFSLQEGSSLPQIVRESRSLDAAKRLGLILDHDLAPDRFYYVMRYVPGDSLSLTTKKLHASSPVGGLGDAQMRAALGYACDLVSTLSTYHRGGLWHKDVKPDNIIIDGSSRGTRAHLVDFGLVSSLRSAMTLTTHGTEYFRDPEMVRLALKGVKVHEVDGTKFDIFGAGAVLYSVIEDSFPAHGVLSQVTKRCPEAVKWIIRRAMTDYDKRYVSSDAMLADLQVVVSASDLFAVKPVELPSMRGGFVPALEQVAKEPAVEASVASVPLGSPIPPNPVAAAPVGVAAAADHAPAAPGVSTRQVPKIRVVNWWSGRSKVEGYHEVPAGALSPDHWTKQAGAWAEKSARVAKQTVDAVVAGVGAGVGSPRPVAEVVTPAAPVQAASIGPRRPAAEQLKSARLRVEAARSRAQTRVSGRHMAARPYKPGVNAGVVVAVVLFLGACVGVTGLLVSGRSGSGGEVNNGIEFVQDEPFFDGESWQVRSVGATVGGDESLAFQVDGRVLLITDILPPWNESVKGRVDQVLGGLASAGLTVVGSVPMSGDAEADAAQVEADINLVADARKALGQTPIDSDEAGVRLSQWLQEHQGDADALIWIAPSGDEKVDAPGVYVFMARTMSKDQSAKQRSEEMTAAVRGAVSVGGSGR